MSSLRALGNFDRSFKNVRRKTRLCISTDDFEIPVATTRRDSKVVMVTVMVDGKNPEYIGFGSVESI